MDTRSNLNIMDFSNIIQALATTQRTGTLKVCNEEDEKKYLYFKDGFIELVYVPGQEDFAATAFLKSGFLDEKQIHSLYLLQSKTHGSIAQLAWETKLLTEAEILDALSFQIQEEVSEIFIWKDVHCEFIENTPPANYQDYNFLSQPVRLNASSLLMEAARVNDEWNRIKQAIPSMKDVYQVSPDSFHFFDENNPRTKFVREILSLVDGVRDVLEITQRAKMSKFDALDILKDLVQEEEILPLKHTELLELAKKAQQKGNLQKALRLYERAEELGADNYDLPDKIAKSYEALGKVRKAIEKYLDFAAKCCTKNDLDEAILTYYKVIRLDPNDLSTHEKLISLLLEENRKEEAVRQYKNLIAKYKKFDLEDKLLEAWKSVCLHSPTPCKEGFEELGQLYRKKEDTVQAIIDFDEMATNFLLSERFEDAILCYQQILQLDEECIEARLQLASTYSQIGRADEAVEEYKKMAEMLSRSGVIQNSTNWQFLVTTYEKIVDLEPDNYTARKWLANAYLESNQPKKALQHLEDIRLIFQRKKQYDQVVEALQSLLQVLPENIQYYEELAQAYLELQEKEKAAQTYHQAGKLSAEQEKFDEAHQYYQRALEIQPFDLSAHQAIASLLKRQNRMEEAVEKYRDIRRLLEGAGMYLEAINVCEEIFRIVYEETYTLKDIARLYEKCQGRRGALEHYVKYARKSLQDNNISEAKFALQKIKALDPNDGNIDAIEFDIQHRENLLAGSPVARQAPPTETRVSPPSQPTTQAKRTSGGTRILRPTISKKVSPSHKKKEEPKPQTLSSQLERLKTLKKGKSSPQPQNAQVKQISVKNFAQHLKALKKGTSPSSSAKIQKDKSLLSAASALKGIKSSPPSTPSSPSTPSKENVDSVEVQKDKSLLSAADILRGMKNKPK
ncbi:MAG: DUF4388 domain-containing protein [Planctomycetota bacterium]|nr:MAG: DUF4388 domain-containing protein [Planctomycetota bacterium]